MIAVPDPSTFQIIPWKTEQPAARMFCDIYEPDGSPFDGDPRCVLKRQLQRAADLGYTFYVGPELEYFYFTSLGRSDSSSTRAATSTRRRWTWRPTAANARCSTSSRWASRSSTSITRSRRRQHEIDLRYTDALTMADSVMAYRLTVKEVAHEFGIYATFMPKPVAGVNGSGMHTHQSLFEGDRNAFFDAGDAYHLSPTAKAYIAGALRYAPEITLVTNQWVNSYKRLVPGFEAPVYVCWARRNRSALGACSPVQARQGGGDADRVPLARPGVQPVPGVRRDAGGRAGGHLGRVWSCPRRPPTTSMR